MGKRRNGTTALRLPLSRYAKSSATSNTQSDTNRCFRVTMALRTRSRAPQSKNDSNSVGTPPISSPDSTTYVGDRNSRMSLESPPNAARWWSLNGRPIASMRMAVVVEDADQLAFVSSSVGAGAVWRDWYVLHR